MYDSLAPRVKKSENKLRSIIGEVVEKKTALRLQAKHLQLRVEACIEHNRYNLEKSIVPVDEFRAVVDDLTNVSSIIKSMVLFNNEILRQKNIEASSKGKAIIPWAGKKRGHGATTVSQADLDADPHHSSMFERLLDIRDLRSKHVYNLSRLLEHKESFQLNLQNCTESGLVLTTLLRRDISDIEVEKQKPFDHSRCADCSFAHAMTCDCTEKLKALQSQATEANKRLQMLVEVRERMKEVAETLEFSNPSSPYGQNDPNIFSNTNSNNEEKGKDENNANKDSKSETMVKSKAEKLSESKTKLTVESIELADKFNNILIKNEKKINTSLYDGPNENDGNDSIDVTENSNNDDINYEVNNNEDNENEATRITNNNEVEYENVDIEEVVVDAIEALLEPEIEIERKLSIDRERGRKLSIDRDIVRSLSTEIKQVVEN
jgi:hypothetical protein